MTDRDKRIENRPNRDIPEIAEEQRTEHLGRKRTPLHLQNTLTSYDRPGFVRRWVNEFEDNVDRMVNAGWTPVVGSENNSSDKRLQKADQQGSVVRISINRNIPEALAHTAILMEMPAEWYNEDKAAKLEENQKRTRALDPNKVRMAIANGEFANSIYGHMKTGYN